MQTGDWENDEARAIALLILELGAPPIYMALNAWHEPVEFSLPGRRDRSWHRLVDTDRGVAGMTLRRRDRERVELPGRSLILLQRGDDG